MARSEGGRPLSGIPEAHRRASGSGSNDAQTPLQRPQQGQCEGLRRSGRFSLCCREKERERERDTEQQEAAIHGQGGSVSGAQAQDSTESQPADRKPVPCSIEALFNYHAARDDPSELSLRKGELLDIVDRSGKWWEERGADGREGIMPSNYLRVIDI